VLLQEIHHEILRGIAGQLSGKRNIVFKGSNPICMSHSEETENTTNKL